jgi:hypothetical protein
LNTIIDSKYLMKKNNAFISFKIMNMKKIVALSLCCLTVLALCGQETAKPVTPAQMVKEFVPQEKLDIYITERPQRLLDLNYYTIGYCYVTDQRPENSQVIGELSSTIKRVFTYDRTQILKDKEVNPLKFELQQDHEKYNIYTIENSKFVVVVRPLSEYQKDKEAYLKQYGY